MTRMNVLIVQSETNNLLVKFLWFRFLLLLALYELVQIVEWYPQIGRSLFKKGPDWVIQ